MPRTKPELPASDVRALARRATLVSVDRRLVDDAGRGSRLWSGLVNGSWSFCDLFEVNQTRFLVARRNHPRKPRLTPTERRVAVRVASGQSLKVVALGLALSSSRVSQCLASALAKLGLCSRAELIRACSEIVPEPDDEEAAWMDVDEAVEHDLEWEAVLERALP